MKIISFAITCILLTGCTTLHYSKFSKPVTNALDEKKSIISDEKGGRYQLAWGNSVYQIKSDDLIIAIKINNQKNYQILAGFLGIPFIPMFGSFSGYPKDRKYIDLVVGFKKKNPEPIYFNPNNLIIETGNNIIKPLSYVNYNSLDHVNDISQKDKVILCSEISNDIEIIENSKFIVRYNINLSSNMSSTVKLSKIKYKDKTIEAIIYFNEDSEWTYFPLFI